MSPHTLHRSTIPPVSGRRDNHRDPREKSNNNELVNRDLNRKEGCKVALTGECACKTARPLGDCGVAVGC